MRVAIVHDYLTQFGGAERVLHALMELFPHAPVYTLVYDSKREGLPVDSRRLKTSFLQRLPGARRSHRYAPLALMPFAVEQFDLRQYDVVISATHSFSKGIITGPQTLHISYCFTPIRYAWDDSHKYIREFSRSSFFHRLAPLALSYIRAWDYYASQRVDMYVTLSHYVANRIQKYYHRPAYVIPPPVEVERFSVSENLGEYYLVVSRLLPYKRVDLAIEACKKLNRPLKIIGTGPEIEDLKQRAAGWDNIEFLGFVSDDDLPGLYTGARALLFPQEEDFGITPVEAAAAGKPTIAYRAGGACETVIEDTTGVFFNIQDIDHLAKAIVKSERMVWRPQVIRQHAEQYDRTHFLQRFGDFVHNQWKLHQKTHAP